MFMNVLVLGGGGFERTTHCREADKEGRGPCRSPAPNTAPGTNEAPNTSRMGTAVPTPSGVVISQSLEISERTDSGKQPGWEVFGK